MATAKQAKPKRRRSLVYVLIGAFLLVNLLSALTRGDDGATTELSLDRLEGFIISEQVVEATIRQDADKVEGVLRCEGSGDERTLTCRGELDAITAAVQEQQGKILEQYTPSLEDIFIAHAGRDNLALSPTPED